jgi:hypothetical protein
MIYSHIDTKEDKSDGSNVFVLPFISNFRSVFHYCFLKVTKVKIFLGYLTP